MKAAGIMQHEEGCVERSNTCAMSPVVRWQTLPLERKLHWLLRLGVVGCFLGHGAYGVLTKEAWVPYFGVVGINRAWAYGLMPWIGIMDIGLGLTMAVVPLPIVLLHLIVWGAWTAALRPLSGDAVWECLERAGNYGVPLALLALAGIPRSLRGWLTPLWPSDRPPLTVDLARTIHWILRVTTGVLLFGHGALGALTNKPALSAHYASIGLQNVAVGGLTLTQGVGCLEIVLAVAVLIAPLPSLLLGICLWKMGTEMLFLTSGSLPFEWVERAGSYTAPLALYALMVTKKKGGRSCAHEVARHEARCDDTGTPQCGDPPRPQRGRLRHRQVSDRVPGVVSPPPHRWPRALLGVVFLVASGLGLQGVSAAERARPLRIGALTASWGPTPQVMGLRDGLRDLGYRDPEHFVLGIRFTQGDTAALAAAARTFVQEGADLLFADADDAAKAAQLATTSVPIVFASVADPLGTGLVHSFAAPGGNVTGVADLGLELSPKRLELFREVIPALRRVLYLYAATDASSRAALTLYHEAARALGMELVAQAVQSEAEAQATLGQSQKGQVDGILAPPSLALNLPGAILTAAAQRGLPTMFSIHGRFFVEHGGLVSYGADPYASGWQAARLVEKIRHGTAPAVIPVEVNARLELVINLKVAAALGYTIAPQVLYQADRLIR